jgi:glycosyltransferase involved in cell wall biosynthesis
VRILTVGSMYPPHHLGGYEVTWRSSVLGLRAAGHECRVLATDFRRADPPWSGEDPDVHRELRWYWHDHGYPRMGLRATLALERHNHAVFERHLRELEPDVVCWWAMGGMSLSLIERARRAGLPAVGVVGDDWLVYGQEVDRWTRRFGRRPRLARLAERRTGLPARVELDGAATWLFNSERTRKGARTAFPELARTRIAHPGVDAELLRAAPPEPWRWRLLYLGRVDPRKGVELAVRALALLPDEARLTICGGGDAEHLEALRAIARELGLEDRVDFVERPRDQVAATYAAADAVLFPVLWSEPWGLVPLEAMAVGRPVVATTRGGQSEYLEDGVNCLVFDPGEGPGALARAVQRLAADEELRDRLRTGGSQTAATYTEEQYNRAIEGALLAAAGL